MSAIGFLLDDQAMAALVLCNSGYFDTKQISDLLQVREDAVYRTIHMAKDLDRQKMGGAAS